MPCLNPLTPTELGDEKLVSLALAGSAQAFEVLVLRHRYKVTATARHFFPQLADAEDLAQDAFIRAYTNLTSLRAGVPFKNWLLKITVNLCLDQLRKQKRRREIVSSQLNSEQRQWPQPQWSSVQENEQLRFERISDARALLARVLDRLSPKDRAVLYLLYDEERSVAEIAKLLGWSKSNVKVRAFRARRALRTAIGEIRKPR